VVVEYVVGGSIVAVAYSLEMVGPSDSLEAFAIGLETKEFSDPPCWVTWASWARSYSLGS